jgi:hypothetical protein
MQFGRYYEEFESGGKIGPEAPAGYSQGNEVALACAMGTELRPRFGCAVR